MKYSKEKIIELRNEGKTYKEISQIIGCTKSTVTYYCGKGIKEKAQLRQKKARKNNTLLKKIENFKYSDPRRKRNEIKKDVKSNPIKLLRHKSDDFQRRTRNKLGERKIDFTYHDVLEKYGEKIKCYLTGRILDLKNPRTYNFDHIIPAAKGGDNSFENLGICCREANLGKGDLMLGEFIQLCKEVLEYHGYKVK